MYIHPDIMDLTGEVDGDGAPVICSESFQMTDLSNVVIEPMESQRDSSVPPMHGVDPFIELRSSSDPDKP